MTDNPAAPIPAGWYADATTPGLMRWWDGVAWTEHTSAAAAPYGVALERPMLPADRPIYSAIIWVIVLLPLVSYGLFFAWQPDFGAMVRSASSTRYDPMSAYSSFLTPGYFAIIAAGWVSWGLTVFLAYRDTVWLKRQGVVRPFHWAFAFFGGLVYVIGRSVIVRRVAAPRGLAPIWASIGVVVAGLIISGVWTALLFAQIASQIPTIDGYGYGS